MSDMSNSPSRTPEMIANHQHWIWMNDTKRWEVRGTGVSDIDPSFITREVYNEIRYTPEVRRIMDEHDQRSAADSPGTIMVRGRELVILNMSGQWLAPGVAAPMPVPDESWTTLRVGWGDDG